MLSGAGQNDFVSGKHYTKHSGQAFVCLDM